MLLRHEENTCITKFESFIVNCVTIFKKKNRQYSGVATVIAVAWKSVTHKSLCLYCEILIKKYTPHVKKKIIELRPLKFDL